MKNVFEVCGGKSLTAKIQHKISDQRKVLQIRVDFESVGITKCFRVTLAWSRV